MEFVLNSILFGMSLAVDGFVITLIGGINSPNLGRGKVIAAAVVFALFQAVATMLGWVCVHTVARQFAVLSQWLDRVAFAALTAIGLKMILDGGSEEPEQSKPRRLYIVTLILQGMATSVDSLAVGFVNADLGVGAALLFSAIISAVTFCSCLIGPAVGRFLGRRGGRRTDGELLDRRRGSSRLSIANAANLVGGCILIILGAKIVL